MLFKELFPNFSVFKSKLNTPLDTSIVQETDKDWFDNLFMFYGDVPFKEGIVNRNQQKVKNTWMDFKIKYVKILQEQEKDILELVSSKRIQDIYTGNNESEMEADLEKLITNGSSDNFKPAIINYLGSIITLPNIRNIFIASFEPIFANINDEEEATIDGIDSHLWKEDFKRWLGVDFETFKSEAVQEIKDGGLAKGDKGDQGATGPKGDKGDPGQPGAKGDKGDQGATGPKGDKGDKGDPGQPGAKGDKGDPGQPGAKGDKGDQGATGPKGDKGDKGDPGQPGAKGDKGDQGTAGPPGPNGPKGDKGDPGSGTAFNGGVVPGTTTFNQNVEVKGKLWKDTKAGEENLFTDANDRNRVPSKSELDYYVKNSAEIAEGGLNQTLKDKLAKIGTGGSTTILPYWEDITNTYKTRDFNNDVGSVFRITTKSGSMTGEFKNYVDDLIGDGYSAQNWKGVHSGFHKISEDTYDNLNQGIWTPFDTTFKNALFEEDLVLNDKSIVAFAEYGIGSSTKETITKIEVLEESKTIQEILKNGGIIEKLGLSQALQNELKINRNINESETLLIADYKIDGKWTIIYSNPEFFDPKPISHSISTNEDEIHFNLAKDLPGGEYKLKFRVETSTDHQTNISVKEANVSGAQLITYIKSLIDSGANGYEDNIIEEIRCGNGFRFDIDIINNGNQADFIVKGTERFKKSLSGTKRKFYKVEGSYNVWRSGKDLLTRYDGFSLYLKNKPLYKVNLRGGSFIWLSRKVSA